MKPSPQPIFPWDSAAIEVSALLELTGGKEQVVPLFSSSAALSFPLIGFPSADLSQAKAIGSVADLVISGSRTS